MNVNPVSYILIKNSYKNCFTKCPSYFYLDKSLNIKFCTESSLCPSSYSKLIYEKEECINKCDEDNEYKYELDNKCYKTCPSGTYPIENEYLCLKEKPEGYYLDSSIYKKCYESCKNCNGYGNDEVNNCNECKSTHPYELIRDNYKNCYDTCPSYFYLDKIININYCTENPICPRNYSKLIFERNECVNKCEEDNYYKFELDSRCYLECPNGTYPKENEYLCLKEKPEGYYLDSSRYKKCFDRCKNCYGYGNETNNNCSECKSNYELSNGTIYPFLYELNIDYYKNCYIKCPSYFYYDKNSNTFYCTSISACPKNYSNIILERNECVYKCEEDNDYKYEFRKRCNEQCPENSTKVENNTVINEYFCKPLCTEENPLNIFILKNVLNIVLLKII